MRSKFFFFFLVITVLFMLGCNKTNQHNQSTISVFGTGTVMAQPDQIQMMITLSNVAGTTQMAQDEVSRMVRQVLSVLSDAGIEDSNIVTTSLSFRSEYEFITRRILIGQRAEQSISFSVDNVHDDSVRVSEIIDSLILINGIELNQMIFNVKDNTEYFTRSRELAFNNAVEKANQYARLSNLTIIRVLNISEDTNRHITPLNNRFMNTSMDFQTLASGRDASSTIVPMGELEITTRLLVEFLLE